MALQDLTPQLRTRLNRMERAVGWFLFVATALLVLGFGFYIYKTAENKGWFKEKIKYHTSIASAAGFKPGDKVLLMGFPVGEITGIKRNAPAAYYNVTIEFWIEAESVGYIWSDSRAKVNADFLGNRFLEVTKGVRGVPTVREDQDKHLVGMLERKVLNQRMKELAGEYPNITNLYKELNQEAHDHPDDYYTNLDDARGYWLTPDDTPTVTDRAQQLVSEVEDALPNFLAITNKINVILSNSAELTYNLNLIAANAQPAISNLNVITANLREPQGSFGEWLLPTNIHEQLAMTLTNADTNLTSLGRTLDNLANITSNLNAQVQANSNILKQVSDIVVHTDEFVQGLKKNWLFRSSFKTPTTNAPTTGVFQSPRAKGQNR